MPSSILLHGAEGTGKLKIALGFAKGLLCHSSTPWGCGECKSCTSISRFEEELSQNREELKVYEDIKGKRVFVHLKGTHPDLILVPPHEGQIRIDQIRSLKDFLSTKPLLSKRKVVLIEAANLMNLQASNSLLKILEEPPNYANLLLTATSLSSLIPTVASRLFPVRIPPLSREELASKAQVRDRLTLSLAKGSLDRLKEFTDKARILKPFRDFPPESAEAALKLANAFEKLELEERLMALDILEEIIYNSLKENRINTCKASELLQRLGELRGALRRGVKGSLALLSFANMWR